jgi:uracil permease
VIPIKVGPVEIRLVGMALAAIIGIALNKILPIEIDEDEDEEDAEAEAEGIVFEEN